MGEVFAGRYELVDPIGRGGVGAVWRAWDHRRRRYVAAKVLQQSDAHSLLRFVREQALRIDHPHVLAPASWAADDDKVLFTMDLVAGGSLVHLIGDYGPLPPLFVCTLLDQLLSGLAAVHAEGVVHRDIKPANILLEATGTARPRLRLSDFGIAMRLGEPRLTETHLVVGTPGYLAPEQMMGAEPDFPADLFAAGLVALYLLQGAKPDAKALVQHFLDHGTPGAPQGVPEPLWQVVATLVQPDPEARFRTATGARKALASATELLPPPGPDDEIIEIFDQLGPLPKGFGPQGPLEPTGADPAAGSGRTGPTVPDAALPFSGRSGRGGRSTRTGTDSEATWPGTGSVPAEAGTGSVPTGWGAAAVAPTDPRRRAPDPSPGAPRPPAHPPTAHPAPGPTPTATPAPTPGPSMSDTGSFHLPPPQEPTPQPAPPREPASHPTPLQGRASHPVPPAGRGSHPAPPQEQAPHLFPPSYAAPAPPPHSAPEPTHTYVLPRADPATASYTTQDPRPVAAQGRRAGRHGRRVSRPGPPARIAVPVLLLALLCYAVGFWALARI
ncbi:serine/threonine-protein kinase [Streptomyces galbus]|uniref:non-specific serine/threonine protein kinase n=1 Tax=Streptomyces galbus TaxID=33898 RepID=A0A4U5XC97_STRGB|nr:serine/threonine-protein kinase [Streptomyces galbus]TKT11276.1 serine/threonine protein kinase [Streptomyces galbus]GHD38940.1 serine/threonine protein kinase [Streptomyces galbus]